MIFCLVGSSISLIKNKDTIAPTTTERLDKYFFIVFSVDFLLNTYEADFRHFTCVKLVVK